MRLTILAFVVALFFAAFACAEPAPKEEIVEETDILRLQLAESRAAELAAKIESAKRDLAELKKLADGQRSALQQKYKLADGDRVDPQTRAIVRAKKDVKK